MLQGCELVYKNISVEVVSKAESQFPRLFPLGMTMTGKRVPHAGCVLRAISYQLKMVSLVILLHGPLGMSKRG